MLKLSASKYQTFVNCPFKYKLRYINKDEGKKTKSTSIEVGKLCHEVLENYREGLDIEELYEMYRSKYTLTDFDKSLIMNILENGIKEYMPYIGRVSKSEDYLKHQLSDDLVIHGFIDKMYLSGEHLFEEYDKKFKLVIVDYKTGKWKGDNSLQLKFYNSLVWRNYGIKPEEILNKILYLRLDDVVNYQFDTPDILEFETHLHTFQEIVENTQNHRSTINKFCKFCEYTDKCEPYKAKQMLIEKSRRKR